jgi:heme/copper-type cytochrome/quinol oxidase subunit 3
MSDVAHQDVVEPHHEEHESTGIENRKLGMWVFLSSEFLFFGALITNYLLYSNRGGFEGTYPAEIYDIPFTSVSSFVLLMSSLTMVLAHNALERHDQPGARTWLFATAALGSVFLGGQVFEFYEFISIYDMTLSTNPAASAFYLLTGFHGTHVAIGIIMLLSLWGISRRQGGLSEQHGLNLELVGLYWHFVDIIWIVIFTVVYLLSIPPA